VPSSEKVAETEQTGLLHIEKRKPFQKK